jgi:tetratricopeptide (TPR) repeat protein
MLKKSLLPLIALVALTPVAHAVPDSGGGAPRAGQAAPPPRPADPTLARKSFNNGFEEYQMATGLEKAGANFSGEQLMRSKEAVTASFKKARDMFRSAVQSDPNMKEAWNMLGYSTRKLGEYEESLQAYDKALALAPDYPEAIEYRAELFLLTGRLPQVKEAYASLLKSSPSYADVLKTSMKDWVKAKKAVPGLSDADRAEFTAWVAKL